MNLLNDEELARTAVVANCQMNRERSLSGSNGYNREVGFDIVDFLTETLESRGAASWLDLCCGSGKALEEAAEILDDDRAKIVGVDLVNDRPGAKRRFTFVASPACRFRSATKFDLATCVHGLHYIGDKLRLVKQACESLTPQGRWIANFDAASIQIAGAKDSKRTVIQALRRAGIEYDARRKRLRCDGRREVVFPFEFLGADPDAGPNYTGQNAVISYYQSS